MMHQVFVKFYDDKSQQAYDASLYLKSNHQFCIHYFDGERCYRIDQIQYLPAVEGVPDVFELPDGARVEFLDALPKWFPLYRNNFSRKIKQIESSWRWVVISIGVVAVFLFALLKFALPIMSYHLAHRLPEDLLVEVANETESYLYELTEPSRLSGERQANIRQLYLQLSPEPQAKIVLRRGGDQFDANAFAIPNNTIILTDELIELTKDDYEILAVLAHEQGHLVHKHSLQQAINGIGLSLIFVVILADTSELLATLPTLFFTAGYSQKFEMQADDFAINELKRLNIPPQHLANFFHTMHEHDEKDSAAWSLLSTHPSSQKRIENVQKQTTP